MPHVQDMQVKQMLSQDKAQRKKYGLAGQNNHKTVTVQNVQQNIWSPRPT
jgi:hypothetical protein